MCLLSQAHPETAIVTLHGFSGHPSDFLYMEKALSQQLALPIRWYHLTLPGHGSHPMPIDFESIQAPIHSIRATLGQQKIILIGYSMGARLALHYALQYPQHINKLILISGRPGLSPNCKRNQRRQKDEKIAQMIRKKGLAAFFAYWNQQPIINSQAHIEAGQKSIMYAARMEHHPVYLAQALVAFSVGRLPSLWHKIHSFNCLTYWITGKKDSRYERIAHRAVAQMPSAFHISIPQTGHAPHLEQPALFASYLMNRL